MEVTDLMIGDWVYNTHNRKPEQVREIMERKVMLDNNELYDYNEIEPVRLIVPTLVINGLEWDNNCGFFKEDRFYHLELLKLDGRIWWSINAEYAVVPLDYIHELQHALRLCRVDKEIIL